jgi:hypothetical protein
MSKSNQKRRRRAIVRLHESQRCHGCRTPGATERAIIKIGLGTKPSKARVFFHRKCLPSNTGAVAA